MEWKEAEGSEWRRGGAERKGGEEGKRKGGRNVRDRKERKAWEAAANLTVIFYAVF